MKVTSLEQARTIAQDFMDVFEKKGAIAIKSNNPIDLLVKMMKFDECFTTSQAVILTYEEYKQGLVSEEEIDELLRDAVFQEKIKMIRTCPYTIKPELN